MKRIILFLLLSLSSLVHALESNYFFLQRALHGYITQTGKNTYSIKLKESSEIEYFPDRPIRQSGKMKLSEFLDMWQDKTIKNNFVDVPPNTAIVMVDRHNKWHNSIVIASNPVRQGNTVIYQIQPIDGKSPPIGELKHVVLFFDDIHWNPGGI